MMMSSSGVVICFLFLLLATASSLPNFRKGRPREGFLGSPPTRFLIAELPKAHYFTQKLDHLDANSNITWNQRYFVNDSFWDKGFGPVFLMIGGEGPANPVWNVEGAWIEYAQENRALTIQLEHRFYGASHPTSSTSVENLRYLTSEQALADLAYFREYMSDAFKTGDAVWIAFGGSYSGALAAWVRLKYPHLFSAAMATSAPVQAQLNFVEYAEVVSASLASKSTSCVSAVQTATTALETMVKSEAGRAELTKLFQLCSPLDADTRNISSFAESVAGNIFGIVQYNKDNRAFEGAVGTNITIDTICSIMLNKAIGNELTRYAALNSLMMKTYGIKCQEISYNAMVDDMKNTNWSNDIGGRMWFYQTCNEFGYYQTTDSKNQPFGTLFPLSFFIKQCIDVFGPEFDQAHIERGIAWTNENYGGKNISATRVLFPNGSIDPWHALGITNHVIGPEKSIYIEGTAHCANMYPPLATDIIQLQTARLQISEQLELWTLEG